VCRDRQFKEVCVCRDRQFEEVCVVTIQPIQFLSIIMF